MKGIWLLRSEGMTSIPAGLKYGWKLQFYYPEFGLRKDEAYLKLGIDFRWVRYADATGTWAFGFKILGLGLGISWQGRKCLECNGLGVIIVNPDNSDLNTVCKSCSGDGAEKNDKCKNCGARHGKHRDIDLRCPDKFDKHGWSHDWLTTTFKGKK